MSKSELSKNIELYLLSEQAEHVYLASRCVDSERIYGMRLARLRLTQTWSRMNAFLPL